MDKVDLYALPPDEPWRYFPGDIGVRRLLRRCLEPIRDRPPNGLTKVAINLAQGFRQQGVDAIVRTAYVKPRRGAYVGIINCPPRFAQMLARDVDCLVGPGVLNTPSDWPDMFDRVYKVKAYLQACEWQADVFRSIYNHDAVKVWPVGIDTDYYKPRPDVEKIYDLMIYDKRRWPDSPPGIGLLDQCINVVDKFSLSHCTITYGKYGKGGEKNFERLASQSRAMVFLCENETQGIAYNQVLSMNVPIIAWDQESWQDPCRFLWGLPYVKATSVPYWDNSCGMKFRDVHEFERLLPEFFLKVQNGRYAPRQFILETLSQSKCTQQYLDLLRDTCKPVV